MNAYVKFILFIGLIILGFLAMQFTPLGQWLATDRLKVWLESVNTTWWAPLAFVAFYVGGCVLAMPSFGLSITGGVIFGFGHGLLYNLIGINIGLVLAFWVARLLGRDYMKKLIKGDKMSQLESILDRHAIKVTIALRILPLLPFNVVNFGAGLSRMKFKDYWLGSIVGVLPGTILFTYLAIAVSPERRNYVIEIAIAAMILTALFCAWKFFPKSEFTKKT